MATLPFIGYSEDCRIAGDYVLTGDRLLESLNSSDEIELLGASVDALSGPEHLERPTLRLAASEFLIIELSGPPGDPGRHVHTQVTRVRAQVGPYLVEGEVHAVPSADPMSRALHRAGPFVPVTRAVVAGDAIGIVRVAVGVAINRMHLSALDEIDDYASVDAILAGRRPGWVLG
ncbi:MAG TPA: hypothetical protein VFK38_02790 [Candidatus Limnocylindrales bacterium]|nr:hypothetical protein [Candidatus Limnocylindrales bacterium]